MEMSKAEVVDENISCWKVPGAALVQGGWELHLGQPVVLVCLARWLDGLF